MRWLPLIKDRVWGILKKITKTRRRRILAYVCLVLITFQGTLSLIHRSRYYFDEQSDDNYCCVEMSRDCEIFFEKLGIRTTLVSGMKYDYNNVTNFTIKKASGELLQISVPQVDSAHEWIILHIGPLSIPYESTWLLPFDPKWRGYETYEMSEGYYVDGKLYTDEQNKIIK